MKVTLLQIEARIQHNLINGKKETSFVLEW